MATVVRSSTCLLPSKKLKSKGPYSEETPVSTATMSTVTTNGILSGVKNKTVIIISIYQSFTRVLLTVLLCELYNKLLLNLEQFVLHY